MDLTDYQHFYGVHGLINKTLSSNEDGYLGDIKNIYFSCCNYIEYLSVALGAWAKDGHLMIQPDLLGIKNWNEKNFQTHLTRTEILKFPELKENQIKNQIEEEKLCEYFHWSKDHLSQRATKTNHWLKEIDNLKQLHVYFNSGLAHNVKIEDIVIDYHQWQIIQLVVRDKNDQLKCLPFSSIKNIDWEKDTMECDVNDLNDFFINLEINHIIRYYNTFGQVSDYYIKKADN